MTQLPPKHTKSPGKGQHKTFGSSPTSAGLRDSASALAGHLHPLSLNGASNNNADSFVSPSDQVVVLVDPYSTGCVVAQEMSKRGYGLVAVWTTGFSDEMKTHIPTSCGPMHYVAEIAQDAAMTLEDMKRAITKAVEPRTVAGCLAGGEAGVDYADMLSEHLGVLSNGTDIPNRRDKKVQQELIRRHGLRSVRQAAGIKLDDVQDFFQTEPFPLVLKPIESAGSDGVKLCYTPEEAKEHFEVLMRSQMVNGGQCPAVLCQEFLKGTEYVVDHVSRDGRHVTTMVWAYDKRPVRATTVSYG
jgi:Phosphoribosylglycinamide synthetase, ATP-grasp (A) domain